MHSRQPVDAISEEVQMDTDHILVRYSATGYGAKTVTITYFNQIAVGGEKKNSWLGGAHYCSRFYEFENFLTRSQ